MANKLYPVQVKGQPNGFIYVEEGATKGLANPQAGLVFKEEGTSLGAAGAADTIDFTGPGVTATRANNTVTINIQAGGMVWNTVTNANVNPAASKNGYIMETGGVLRTVTLPLNVPAGFSTTVNANAGQVRIVSNGNTIDRVGAGNDLLLDDNSTATLVAKATGSLEILSAGIISVPGGGNSGMTRLVNSISTTTTAGSSPSTDYVYLVSGTTTLTLPTAVGNTNRYTVSNIGVGVVSIATTGGQTIHGSAAPITLAVDSSLDLVSSGTNWRII